MTKPQNEQNEYTFAFISMYSYRAIQNHKTNKTNRVWLIVNENMYSSNIKTTKRTKRIYFCLYFNI